MMNDHFSKRFLQRLDSPKFFETKEIYQQFINEERAGAFEFKVEIQDQPSVILYGLIDENQSPQKLVAMKYTCEGPCLQTAFIDAYIDLITNKDEMKIPSISFREVDSFLRDQNNVPAVGEKNTVLFAFFETTKSKILELFNGPAEGPISGEKSSPTIRNHYIPKKPTLLSQYSGKTYLELDSQEKQNFVQEIFSEFISAHLKRDGGGAQIVFCDDSMVVIDYLGACVSCSYSLSSTLSFIQQVLRYETNQPNMLVMTDS